MSKSNPLGGWDENLRVIRRFGDVKAGQLCLDIGVGIGGGARQFAKVGQKIKNWLKSIGFFFFFFRNLEPVF